MSTEDLQRLRQLSGQKQMTTTEVEKLNESKDVDAAALEEAAQFFRSAGVTVSREKLVALVEAKKAEEADCDCEDPEDCECEDKKDEDCSDCEKVDVCTKCEKEVADCECSNEEEEGCM